MCVRVCGPGGPVEPLRQMTQQAESEALSHVDGALEWAWLSPALSYTASTAGAGWPGAATYFPLIKAGMGHVMPIHQVMPSASPFLPL